MAPGGQISGEYMPVSYGSCSKTGWQFYWAILGEKLMQELSMQN